MLNRPIIVAVLFSFALSSFLTFSAAAATYTYAGNNFTSASNLFTTSDSMSISIATSS